MCIGERLAKPRKLLALGAIFSGVAGASVTLLPRWTHWSESATDMFTGMLFGIAIGTLLVAVAVARKARG